MSFMGDSEFKARTLVGVGCPPLKVGMNSDGSAHILLHSTLQFIRGFGSNFNFCYDDGECT
jgi:hypothetical protein